MAVSLPEKQSPHAPVAEAMAKFFVMDDYSRLYAMHGKISLQYAFDNNKPEKDNNNMINLSLRW